MTSIQINDDDRLITVHYDSMDLVISKEESMRNTLQNNLNRTGNAQYIRETFYSVLDMNGKIRHCLNFILTPSPTEE